MWRDRLKQRVKDVVGRSEIQPALARLHRMTLLAMNYGRGSDPHSSGERFVLETVKRRVPNGARAVVFDVGANTGDYASEVLEVFGDQADVHSFEPAKSAFTALRQRFGDRRNLRLLPFGLSAEKGNVPLYADADGSAMGSVFKRNLDHLGLQVTHAETIELRRLDDYCAEAGVERIHFLKLDVEGNELASLTGAKRFLDEGRIDAIQFEFGGCNIDSRVFFRDFYALLSPRFRIHRVLRHGLQAIEAYSEYQEVFTTTNYLALAR